MKRFFTSKQRQAIYLASGGKCQSCGTDISKGFHADHIIPYSAGGITDVINGQALCAACNLRKGNKMKFKLRSWQQDAQQEVMTTYKGKSQSFFLLQATPGGGKTICALSIFHEMKKSGMVDKLIIVAPSTTLVKQWSCDAIGAALPWHYDLSVNLIYNSMPDFHLYSGMVMTYQGMNENSEALRIFCAQNRTLIIADEMHHVADGKSWGDSFYNAFSGSAHILGLTGTPWASNGQSIPFVTYDDQGFAVCDFKYSKISAIQDKVCRVTEFHAMKPKDLRFYDNTSGEVIGEYKTIEEAKEAKIPRAYLKTLQNVGHMKTLFMDADEQLSQIRAGGVYDAGGLLVAPDIRTAHLFQDAIFEMTGEDFRIVHSKADKPHKQIEEFRNSRERWLISVDMVTEGVDIKRLQVCVFLSSKNTELFLRQVIGRIERRRDKQDHIDQTGFFFYTDTDELSELIARLEDENQNGLAMLEQEQDQGEPEEGDLTECGSIVKIIDDVLLEEVETERSGLIAQGHRFSQEVVAAAIKEKRVHDMRDTIPLFMFCIIEETRLNNAGSAQKGAVGNPVSLDEKKDRLRKRIAKEVTRKLYTSIGRQPGGSMIKMAHKHINRRIGISVTDDSTSVASLEEKLAYVTETRAETWL